MLLIVLLARNKKLLESLILLPIREKRDLPKACVTDFARVILTFDIQCPPCPDDVFLSSNNETKPQTVAKYNMGFPLLI